MATPKKKEFNLMDSLREASEEWEANNVKRRWGIKEFKQAEYNDFPDGHVPEINRLVSPEFVNKEDAWAWADEHDPAPGTTFALARIDYQQINYIQRFVF